MDIVLSARIEKILRRQMAIKRQLNTLFDESVSLTIELNQIKVELKKETPSV